MNKYEIQKDDTMHDFAKAICNLIPMNRISADFHKEREAYIEEYMNLVQQLLLDDTLRTNINYEELMGKYAKDIGLVLYDIDNHGFHYLFNEISFFGNYVESSFNQLMYFYIYFMKFGSYDGDFPDKVCLKEKEIEILETSKEEYVKQIQAIFSKYEMSGSLLENSYIQGIKDNNMTSCYIDSRIKNQNQLRQELNDVIKNLLCAYPEIKKPLYH